MLNVNYGVQNVTLNREAYDIWGFMYNYRCYSLKKMVTVRDGQAPEY